MSPEGALSLVPSSSHPRPLQRSRVVSGHRGDVQMVIREMLSRAGLTKTEVAARMGCSPQNVIQMTNGTLSSRKVKKTTYRYERKPSVEWLARLAVICGAQLVIRYAEISEKDAL